MARLARKAVLVTLVGVILSGSGCSAVTNQAPLRNSEQVQVQTERKSSQVLDIIDLDGKVTEARATITRCSDYPEEAEVYRARHPWSLYGVPVEQMRQGMQRLRENLPDRGWKIVKDGHDGSAARSPQIIANSKHDDFSVDVRLWDEEDSSKDKSLIVVTVVSGCYRSR